MAAKQCYDIMMLYSKDDEQKVKEIMTKLEGKGYSVYDSMTAHGNYKKLAAGVENSFVVLVCATEAFAEDKHCGKAAEYADKKEKPMLFLKVQEQYIPSGLLGILMGAEEEYDFTGREVFATAMTTLCRDLPPPRSTSGKNKAFEEAVEAFKALHIKVRQRRKAQDGDRKK